MMMRCASLASALAVVAGHGSMIMPASRNSVDADPGMPWADGKFPETGLIEPYTCHCVNGTSPCSAGQSCFWCVDERNFWRPSYTYLFLPSLSRPHSRRDGFRV